MCWNIVARTHVLQTKATLHRVSHAWVLGWRSRVWQEGSKPALEFTVRSSFINMRSCFIELQLLACSQMHLVLAFTILRSKVSFPSYESCSTHFSFTYTSRIHIHFQIFLQKRTCFSLVNIQLLVHLISKALRRLNRGDVWIDKNSMNAFLLQRFDTLWSRVIEFSSLSNRKTSRTDHKNFGRTAVIVRLTCLSSFKLKQIPVADDIKKGV